MTAARACPGCGLPVAGTPTCPSCGQALGLDTLPVGTALGDGRFTITGVIGRGGFGITYAAVHVALEREVAIKELFPLGCHRVGRDVGAADPAAFATARAGFLAEGRALARLDLPGVVRVRDAFAENGTAYLVMTRLHGETLERRLGAGPLAPDVVLRLIDGLAETLDAVHAAHLLHRDLKPGNVFLPADGGRAILIDFGAAARYTPGAESQLERLVTPGYAPLEQYAATARFGPPTDVYGLAALAYHALVGAAPPPAPDRAQGAVLLALPPGVPAAMAATIVAGLALRVADRPPSAAAFRHALDPAPPPMAPVPPTPAPTVEPAYRVRHVLLGLVALVIACMPLVYAVWAYSAWEP